MLAATIAQPLPALTFTYTRPCWATVNAGQTNEPMANVHFEMYRQLGHAADVLAPVGRNDELDIHMIAQHGRKPGRVASGTPVSCATAATGLLCGALIWLSAWSFFSLVYFVIVKSIAPGQIRTPIAGGDNYFDRGGRHRSMVRGRLYDHRPVGRA